MSKITSIIDSISALSSSETGELKTALRERFDIPDFGNVVALPGIIPPIIEDEKLYTIVVTDAGTSKMNVLKAVREILNLGLKEAKDFIDNLPGKVKEDIDKAEAEDIKAKITAAGGTVELR